MGKYLHLPRGIRGDYLRRQGGRCAICFTKVSRGSGKFALDHDHRRGGIRGVLCIGCNTGLGGFCDSPELLKRAIEYLGILRIPRFPRKLRKDETGETNIKKATSVASTLPKTKKFMKVFRRKCSANRWKTDREGGRKDGSRQSAVAAPR